MQTQRLDLEITLPHFIGDFAQPPAIGAAGAVDEDVHAAKLRHSRFRRGFDGVRLFEVHHHGDHFGRRMLRAHFGGGIGEAFFIAAEQRELNTFGGIVMRDGEADAAVGAGDDGFFAGEVKVHGLLSGNGNDVL